MIVMKAKKCSRLKHQHLQVKEKLQKLDTNVKNALFNGKSIKISNLIKTNKYEQLVYSKSKVHETIRERYF